MGSVVLVGEERARAGLRAQAKRTGQQFPFRAGSTPWVRYSKSG
jgi:hypothetical protein